MAEKLVALRNGNSWILSILQADGRTYAVFQDGERLNGVIGIRVVQRPYGILGDETTPSEVRLLQADGQETSPKRWWDPQVVKDFIRRVFDTPPRVRQSEPAAPTDAPHPHAHLVGEGSGHRVFATRMDFRSFNSVRIWIDGDEIRVGNRDIVQGAVMNEAYVLVEYEEHMPNVLNLITYVGTHHRKLIVRGPTPNSQATYIIPSESGYRSIGSRIINGRPWFAVLEDPRGFGFRIHWGQEVSDVVYGIRYIRVVNDVPLCIAQGRDLGLWADRRPPQLLRGTRIIDSGDFGVPHFNGDGHRIGIGSSFLVVNGQAAYVRGDIPFGEQGWNGCPQSILVEGHVLGHFAQVYMLWAEGAMLHAVVDQGDGSPRGVSYEIPDLQTAEAQPLAA